MPSIKEIGEKKKAKGNLRYQRDKNRENVRGIFKYYEVPGGTVSFVFKEFKEDQVERYDFIDGKTYSVPLGVAKHLNKRGWYPIHQHIKTEDGTAMRIGEKVQRFGFQSLEFIDVDDLTTEPVIAMVEKVPVS
jgi:hypothetical protein